MSEAPDPAKAQAEHERRHWCTHGAGHGSMALHGRTSTGVMAIAGECLPYRLASLALDLQGKVARVREYAGKVADEAVLVDGYHVGVDLLSITADGIGECEFCGERGHGNPEDVRGCPTSSLYDVAFADPTPAALCPKVSPLETLTDRTCAKPAGHAGPCLFAGHDGRTDLEVMPK